MHKYNPIYVHHQGTHNMPPASRPLDRGCIGGRRSIQSIEQMVERVTAAISKKEDDGVDDYREEF
jgi:hypothetical protein